MRRLPLLAAGILALAVSSPSRAEVQVRIQMGLPAILPPLVEVQPGVQVVQDFDQEIFFIGGYYWVQRDNRWYRTHDHRGTWRYVAPASVPPVLSRHQPGQYRNWQHDDKRAWPAARDARPAARHWRPTDGRERRPADEGRKPQPERKDDKREGGDHGERGH